MQRRLSSVILTLIVLVCPATSFAVSVEDVSNPRNQRQWVTDLVEMIDPAHEQVLNSLIESADRELSVEIAVVTVEAVDTATPKDFATRRTDGHGLSEPRGV